MNYDAQGERQFDSVEVTPVRVLDLTDLDAQAVTDIAEEVTGDTQPEFLPLGIDEIARGVELLIFRWGDPSLSATIKAINAADSQDTGNTPKFSTVAVIRRKKYEVELLPRSDAFQPVEETDELIFPPGYNVTEPYLLEWDEDISTGDIISLAYFEHVAPEEWPTFLGVLPEYYAILTKKL